VVQKKYLNTLRPILCVLSIHNLTSGVVEICFKLTIFTLIYKHKIVSRSCNNGYLADMVVVM